MKKLHTPSLECVPCAVFPTTQKEPLHDYILKLIYYCMCMGVFLHVFLCLVPAEARRGHLELQTAVICPVGAES